MGTINVFEDKDGDYVVTDAERVEPGITAWQLSGEASREQGGPIAVLESMPSLVLLVNKGELGKDTADFIQSLEHKLVQSVTSVKLSQAIHSRI
jgi:hypothetical protein